MPKRVNSSRIGTNIISGYIGMFRFPLCSLLLVGYVWFDRFLRPPASFSNYAGSINCSVKRVNALAMFSPSVPLSTPDLSLCANWESRVYIEGTPDTRKNAARRECPVGAPHHLQTRRARAFFRRSQPRRTGPAGG